MNGIKAELPFGIVSAVMVEDQHGGIVLVGGHSGTTYSYLNTLYHLPHAGPDAQWIKMDQE